MSTILGIGTDISLGSRFRAARHPARVAAFFLSGREWDALQTAPDIARGLASRFAAKEAVIKSVPVRVRPLDFEITKVNEKPVVSWSNNAFPYQVFVSMSHDSEYAQASAICIST